MRLGELHSFLRFLRGELRGWVAPMLPAFTMMLHGLFGWYTDPRSFFLGWLLHLAVFVPYVIVVLTFEKWRSAQARVA